MTTQGSLPFTGHTVWIFFDPVHQCITKLEKQETTILERFAPIIEIDVQSRTDRHAYLGPPLIRGAN